MAWPEWKALSEHYYTSNPTSRSCIRHIDFEYRGTRVSFETDNGVFSKTEVDLGSEVLIKALPQEIKGEVLDLGCGWGAVGVSLAKHFSQAHITMSDVNERALALAKKNAEINGVQVKTVLSDGLNAIEGSFDFIITNPPIRAGKQVIYRLFEQASGQLNEGGTLYIVIRKQQGADSAVKFLRTLFTTVETVDRSGGFHVIACKHT